MNVISIEQVSVSFDRHSDLLHNINLEVKRGETFVVIGPSGSGKSVLLKMVAGLIDPTGGHIKIDNLDLRQISREQKATLLKKMGMLFQKNALFDSLTVAENLAFPLREAEALKETEIQAKVQQFLGFVGLSDAANLFPDEISGGMQKRVGIARALILNPEVILYDDPTAGLDPITSRLIIELIMKLNEELGTTVIAITNEMNRAYQMADRIGIILDHQLVITGDVAATKNFANPHVQAFIRGEFDHGD